MMRYDIDNPPRVNRVLGVSFLLALLAVVLLFVRIGTLEQNYDMSLLDDEIDKILHGPIGSFPGDPRVGAAALREAAKWGIIAVPLLLAAAVLLLCNTAEWWEREWFTLRGWCTYTPTTFSVWLDFGVCGRVRRHWADRLSLPFAAVILLHFTRQKP